MVARRANDMGWGLMTGPMKLFGVFMNDWCPFILVNIFYSLPHKKASHWVQVRRYEVASDMGLDG